MIFEWNDSNVRYNAFHSGLHTLEYFLTHFHLKYSKPEVKHNNLLKETSKNLLGLNLTMAKFHNFVFGFDFIKTN